MADSPTRRERPVRRLLVAAVAVGISGFPGGHACAADAAFSDPTSRSPENAVAAPFPNLRADFAEEVASPDARQIADWVVRTGDNRGMPFIIVDKKSTRVFVFDGRARLRGATAALLGLALGDDSSPGIGSLPLSDIRPEARTTPAGRFVASLGRNLDKQETLWIDYETALALHQVRASGTRQHRLERLGVRSPLSRRITFGCINVSGGFYDDVVHPNFEGRSGVVYILPDTKTIGEVFFGASAPS